MKPIKYVYLVDFLGDIDAGMYPYTDKITVIVDSGDPGGERKEFAQYIRSCLVDWFDGAKIDWTGNG